MLPARLAWLKHVLYAILLLVFFACATEVGLRVYDLRTGEITTDVSEAEGLVVNCWQMHHRLKPLANVTAHNPDTGEPIRVRINSHGLRGPEVGVPKPPGVYRIVCLGDEHTLAAAVDRSHTFCEQLRLLLQRRTRLTVEVLNAGVPGYCPLLSYLQVKHSLLALQPDLLILNFDMSDVADDSLYRRHTRIGSDGAPLACPNGRVETNKQSAVERIDDQFFIVKLSKSSLDLLQDDSKRSDDASDIHAQRGKYAWLKDNPPDWRIYIQQALSPIERLKQLADRGFLKLVVTTYPTPWQVSPAASSGGGVRSAAGVAQDALFESRRPFEIVAEYHRRRDIPFCDVSPAFKLAEQREQLYLANADEFSPRGHAAFARELASFLVEHLPNVWGRDPLESQPAELLRHASSQRP